MKKWNQFDQSYFLGWLVANRSSNQRVALELLTLIRSRSLIIKEKNLENICQGLISVTFSLWRAVFLADKIGDGTAILPDAEKFLENLIAHNFVSYPQDRGAKEWSFNYYINNARYRIEYIARSCPDILSLSDSLIEGQEFEEKEWLDHWTYYHDALIRAVDGLKRALGEKEPGNNKS